MLKTILGLLIIIIIISVLSAFMTFRSLQSSNEIKINLPQTESIEDYELLLIHIDKEIYTATYKTIEITNGDLGILLTNIQESIAMSPEQKIDLIPDKEMSYFEVLETLEFLKKAGYLSVQIRTND